MTLDIKENNSLINTCYIRKMSLDDIKEMHKAFYGLNSCSEFLDYLKQLIENKKLFIKENEENISIDLEILYLFKRSTVEISLVQEKINSEEVVKSIIKELLLIKEQIKDLNKQTNETIESNNKEEIIKLKEEISNLKSIKEENKKMVDDIEKLTKEINYMKELSEKNKKLEEELNSLKEQTKKNNTSNGEDKSDKITELEEDNKLIKEDNKNMKLEVDKLSNNIKYIKTITDGMYNRSNFLRRSEFDFLKEEIEKKIKKKVKGLEKIYQASIEGGDSSIFHSKCDNISNTLTLIFSEKARIFGGFTSETWDISGKYKDDKNSFLFSIDKHKIYSYKCNGKAIYCHKDFGPTFGAGFTIKIGKNALIRKELYTYEFYPDGCSYNFNEDLSALSESGKGKATYIYAREYEVYKILFENISSDFVVV
jgi:hypothetical protein